MIGAWSFIARMVAILMGPHRIHTGYMISLSNGSHNLRVQASDAAGNLGTSQTVYFTVSKQELLPIVWIAVVVAALVSSGLALFVYSRRNKNDKKPAVQGKTQLRETARV
jgi:hypothetical protein